MVNQRDGWDVNGDAGDVGDGGPPMVGMEEILGVACAMPSYQKTLEEWKIWCGYGNDGVGAIKGNR